MHWRSRGPAETERAARALAASLERAGERGGAAIALVGPLGAGKTAFAKGVAAGVGVEPALLASPTFVIANELPAPGGLRLVHADFYRLESVAELEAAGWLDWLGPGVLLMVEWADRFPGELPADHLRVELAHADAAEARSLHATAHGPDSEALLARWRELLS